MDGSRGRDPWRAGRWERAGAAAFLGRRRADSSFSNWQLQTVCEAVGAVIRRHMTTAGAADAVAAALGPTRVACDSLDFTLTEQALAYMVQHLADRDGRVSQLLERLLATGHLPLRKSRLTVLDVGAGPAPALYAAHDFYDDLRAWASGDSRDVEFTSATDMHALDRGGRLGPDLA